MLHQLWPLGHSLVLDIQVLRRGRAAQGWTRSVTSWSGPDPGKKERVRGKMLERAVSVLSLASVHTVILVGSNQVKRMDPLCNYLP